MTEFLTEEELTALKKVIAKARAEPGTHRAATPEGEAGASQYIGQIRWFVNGESANLASGSVPLKRRKLLG